MLFDYIDRSGMTDVECYKRALQLGVYLCGGKYICHRDCRKHRNKKDRAANYKQTKKGTKKLYDAVNCAVPL